MDRLLKESQALHPKAEEIKELQEDYLYKVSLHINIAVED
jgi:hypothetical protein